MRRLARVARRLLPSRVLLSLLLLATAVSWAASLPQPIASAPSSYSSQGYTIFAADSGTFNFDTPYDGDCYSAGCGTSGWVAAAADLQTGGYFYANSCGTVAAFGMSVSPIYISTGCDLVAVAVPDNGTGAWAMDSSGNVYAEGGAPSYGGVGDCGCWKQIMPLPAGGYELLAANGVVNGFGPGAWNNTTAWDTSGNLVAGAYDPTTNSVYALSSAGCVYRITPGAGTQLACYSMGSTPVAIAADNVSGWWALDSGGQVYAGSGAPYLGNAPSPLNAPAIAIGGYEVAPSISSLSATSFVSQNGGTITVNGSAFDYGSATVYLNGNALSTTWNSSTSLTATLPPEAPGGYTITVGDVIGSSGGDAISYSCAAPTITSITPASLDTTTGGSVTVTGNDFFCPGSTSSASFNGTGISYTTNSSANSYSISMSLPTEVTPGSYTIQLTNPGGSASSGESYVYPPPSGVASFQVSDTSPAATTVTGSDFYGTTSLSFQYGSNAAVSEPATVNSPTSLVVTPPTPAQLGVPTSSDATVNVTVNSGGGSTTTTATYIAAPVISSLSTSSFTYSGGAVTLTGSDFVSPVNVTFANGSTTVTDTVTPTSSTSLTVTAPTASALGISSTSSATATVTVSAFGGSSSASTITYYPAPTISSLGTTSFTYAGASTTVTGTGFYSPVTVTFANGSTTVTDTVTPTSSSSLTVTTPTASALGISSTTSTPVTVTVTAFGGTSNSSTITYYPAPVISAVNTAYMPFNGGSMTLGGTGFYSPLSIVFQYGTNSPVSVTATPTSSTSVTFNSPSATALGLTGTATESVSFYVSAAGGSSASNSVDYVPNPIITGVSPNQLTFSGGTISVTGSNFVNPVSVSFQYGTNAAVTTSVAPTSSTTLSVTAPTAAALGISSTTAVSVVMTLTTFSGSSPESANYALTYYPPATVASVTPNQLAFSGSTLTITGTGFYSPVTVTFANGSTTVTDTVTPSSSTSLTVAAPAAGTLGISGTTAVPVSVTVSAFGGTSSAATITYYPTPAISSISPGQLTFSGGSLNVTGTGFYPVLSVTFTNGATVVTETVTPTSSTALTVTAPAASALGVTTTGDVSVTITTPGGTSSAYSVLYVAPPTISASTPADVPATGTPITLTGTNFYSPVTVTFANGSTTVTDSVTPTSSTNLTVTAPTWTQLGLSLTGGSQTATVTVSAFGGTSSSTNLTYYSDPTVTTLTVTPSYNVSVSGTDSTVTGDSVTLSANVTYPSGGSYPSFSGLSAPGGSVQFLAAGTDIGSPVTLDSSGNATLATTSLPVSVTAEDITVTYVPSTAEWANSTSAATPIIVYPVCSASLTMTDLAQYSGLAYTSPLTNALTCGTSGLSGVSTTFTSSNAAVASFTSATAAQATATATTSSTGDATAPAIYAGDTPGTATITTTVNVYDQTLTSSVTLTNNADPTVAAVSASPQNTVSGDSVTLAANVAYAVGGTYPSFTSLSAPAGTVQFYAAGNPIGSPVTLDSTGNATLATTALPISVSGENVTGVYTPATTQWAGATSSPFVEIIYPVCTTSANPTSATQYAGLTYANFTDTLTCGTSGLSGVSATFTSSNTNVVAGSGGSSSVSATTNSSGVATVTMFAGTTPGTAIIREAINVYDQSLTSQVSVTTVADPTVTTLTVTPSYNVSVSGTDSTVTGDSVTLSANVTYPSGGSYPSFSGLSAPAGAIQFYAGGVAVGSPVTLDSSGNASLATTALPVSVTAEDITVAYTAATTQWANSTSAATPIIVYPVCSTSIAPTSATQYAGEEFAAPLDNLLTCGGTALGGVTTTFTSSNAAVASFTSATAAQATTTSVTSSTGDATANVYAGDTPGTATITTTVNVYDQTLTQTASLTTDPDPTSTTLSTSSTSTTSGSAVTLTATVSNNTTTSTTSSASLAPGTFYALAASTSGVNTGDVVFSVAGSAVATVPVVNGVASFVDSNLPSSKLLSDTVVNGVTPASPIALSAAYVPPSGGSLHPSTATAGITVYPLCSLTNSILPAANPTVYTSAGSYQVALDCGGARVADAPISFSSSSPQLSIGSTDLATGSTGLAAAGQLAVGPMPASAKLFAKTEVDLQTVSSSALVTSQAAITLTSLASTAPSIVTGGSDTLTASVSSGVAPVVGGDVVFAQGAKTLATVPLVNGAAAYSAPGLPIGTDGVSATYEGATGFDASAGASSLIVYPLCSLSLSPTLASASVGSSFGPLHASVECGGAPMPGVPVTFGLTGGADFTGVAGATTSSQGLASSSEVVAGAATGTASATAAVSIDDQSLSADSPLAVIAEPTQLSLSPSHVTLGIGISVKLAATVTAGGQLVGIGQVAFATNGKIFATVPVVNGLAATTINTPGSAETVTALYLPSGSYSTAFAMGEFSPVVVGGGPSPAPAPAPVVTQPPVTPPSTTTTTEPLKMLAGDMPTAFPLSERVATYALLGIVALYLLIMRRRRKDEEG